MITVLEDTDLSANVEIVLKTKDSQGQSSKFYLINNSQAWTYKTLKDLITHRMANRICIMWFNIFQEVLFIY